MRFKPVIPGSREAARPGTHGTIAEALKDRMGPGSRYAWPEWQLRERLREEQ